MIMCLQVSFYICSCPVPLVAFAGSPIHLTESRSPTTPVNLQDYIRPGSPNCRILVTLAGLVTPLTLLTDLDKLFFT